MKYFSMALGACALAACALVPVPSALAARPAAVEALQPKAGARSGAAMQDWARGSVDPRAGAGQAASAPAALERVIAVGTSFAPEEVSVSAREARTVLEEGDADARIRAAHPGGALVLTSVTHAKTFVCLKACEGAGIAAPAPLDLPVEFEPTLDGEGALSFRLVRLMVNGAPAAGARVLASNAAGAVWTLRTDAAGRFTLPEQAHGPITLKATRLRLENDRRLVRDVATASYTLVPLRVGLSAAGR